MTDAISPELALVDSTLRAAAIEMLPPVVALEFLQFKAPRPVENGVSYSERPSILLAALVYTVAALLRSALFGLSTILALVVLVSAVMLLK